MKKMKQYPFAIKGVVYAPSKAAAFDLLYEAAVDGIDIETLEVSRALVEKKQDQEKQDEQQH